MNKYIEKYREGYSIAEISSTYQLSSDEVETIMDALTTDDIKTHRHSLNKRVLKLHEEGLTINAISRTTGISLSFVKLIINNEA